jgi:hypothetical protein
VCRVLVAVVALLAGALVGSPAARAHVNVSPGLLEAGEVITLEVELPRLRPGAPPSSLGVSGGGVRQLSAEAAGPVGVESRWRVRVRVGAQPGPLTLLLRADFSDGQTVVVRHAVTVVPARAGGGTPTALLVAIAAVSVAAVGGLALLLLRGRRSG